jgi:hypothetical protein
VAVKKRLSAKKRAGESNTEAVMRQTDKVAGATPVDPFDEVPQFKPFMGDQLDGETACEAEIRTGVRIKPDDAICERCKAQIEARNKPVETKEEVVALANGLNSALGPNPKTIGEFIEQAFAWIKTGGNIGGAAVTVDGINLEIIVRREGFQEEERVFAKDRVYTLEAFHCALGTADINQIDGVPAAYMEVPTESYGSTSVTKSANRWNYRTLRFGSHLADPVARVELLNALLKVIKNAAEQVRSHAQPLVVWRQRPHFDVDTDQGVTYLRCRLFMPGVNLPDFSGSWLESGTGVFWVEGV